MQIPQSQFCVSMNRVNDQCVDSPTELRLGKILDYYPSKCDNITNTKSVDSLKQQPKALEV